MIQIEIQILDHSNFKSFKRFMIFNRKNLEPQAFSQTLGGLFSLLSNGVGWQMVAPSSLPALWNLVRATGSNAFGSSESNSVGKMALKMALPPPLALLL